MSTSQPSVAPEPQPEGGSGDLHSLAVDVQTDLQTLATGLAHAGASPQAVATLTRMAQIVSQIVKVLGEAQPSGQGAPPPPGQGAPPPSPPQHQPAPGNTAPPHAALGQAVAALHEGMQASAARRAATGQ